MTQLTPDVRALLQTVHDAIAIPFPATVGDGQRYRDVLEARVRTVRVTIEAVLDDRLVRDLAWETDLLRELLAENPATGYVTNDQARAALADGKTWAEAVTPAGEADPS